MSNSNEYISCRGCKDLVHTSDYYTFFPCVHTYCTRCCRFSFEQQIEHISIMNVEIYCPDPDCTTSAVEDQLLLDILGYVQMEEVRKKWNNLNFLNSLSKPSK
jgi:hypothetical protein